MFHEEDRFAENSGKAGCANSATGIVGTLAGAVLRKMRSQIFCKTVQAQTVLWQNGDGNGTTCCFSNEPADWLPVFMKYPG